METIPENLQEAYRDYVLRLADTELIAGHRMSEWCGHGPVLEEDIALANMALDSIGHAKFFLEEAGKYFNPKKSADDLAYFRSVRQFKTALIAELPRGDFAFTILRHYFCAVFLSSVFKSLDQCQYQPLKAMGAKFLKETQYHVRHTGSWVCRLSDGTEESRKRIEYALNELMPYVGDLFADTEADQELHSELQVPLFSELKAVWESEVKELFMKATLPFVDNVQFISYDSRSGLHTEYLGQLLDEMQSLARQHPGANW